jgi:DNA-binding NarL/FixJ family response regulator
MSNNIRLLIADDHEMVRSSLALFLEAYSDIQIIGEAASGVEVLEFCATQPPDVVLMDLLMPRMNGIEATQALRQSYPTVRVVILSATMDSEMFQAALEAGAIRFLSKNAPMDELYTTIRRAADQNAQA